MVIHKRDKRRWNWKTFWFVFLLTSLPVFLSACSEIQKPGAEPFYAKTSPPAKQEFRWSNGKTPRSFDPARAGAPPETDVVRALFEGLTDLDSRTLKEKPAAAEKWTSSADLRVWTFQLRKDARWSNGERLTAEDFVTSWKRLATLGDKTAHRELFQNIVGFQTAKTEPMLSDPIDLKHSPALHNDEPHNEKSNSIPMFDAISQQPPDESVLPPQTEAPAAPKTAKQKFGVEAIDEHTLRVRLEVPDKDFPKLVANPIFRPIYGDGVEFDDAGLDADVVTNGPFTVASVSDGIVLDRSETYWNKAEVSLEHVRFVSKENAESALSAYKKGEIDVMTNAEFEPLAVKILSPYDDFRQATHSALNFYEFNTKKLPFNDRRVREALAISIDRDRITDGDLERTARPALSFLPLNDNKSSRLSLDVEKARQQLESAGFPGGADFPKIRLLINRNDTQQRVARSVAKMWKQNLNLDTEIVVKELSEIDAARELGDYDLVRRGVVLPTTDEVAGIAAIFRGAKRPQTLPAPTQKLIEHESRKSTVQRPGEGGISDPTAQENSDAGLTKNEIVTEDDALFELNAIPLYFPMSYSLVKPYVNGFEVNGLDATTLADISIDSSWQSKIVKGSS